MQVVGSVRPDGTVVTSPRVNYDAVYPARSVANGIADIYDLRDYNNAMARASAREARDWSSEMFGRQMAFNSAEAAANRSWQEYMSSSAHQREVRDLMAAGLNPVLSANGGASTPSGSAGTAALPSTAPSEVDMSVSNNVAQLLTAMIGADAQVKSTNLTAANQVKVAEMNNSLAKLLNEANISAQLAVNAANLSNNKYLGELSAETAIKTAGITSAASLEAANMTSSATRYAAEQSRLASQYAADSSAANPQSMWGIINRGINGLLKWLYQGYNSQEWSDYLQNPFMDAYGPGSGFAMNPYING